MTVLGTEASPMRKDPRGRGLQVELSFPRKRFHDMLTHAAVVAVTGSHRSRSGRNTCTVHVTVQGKTHHFGHFINIEICTLS